MEWACRLSARLIGTLGEHFTYVHGRLTCERFVVSVCSSLECIFDRVCTHPFEYKSVVLPVDGMKNEPCVGLQFPSGLVVRISCSHRDGRGSIPRLGGLILSSQCGPRKHWFVLMTCGAWHTVQCRFWGIISKLYFYTTACPFRQILDYMVYPDFNFDETYLPHF